MTTLTQRAHVIILANCGRWKVIWTRRERCVSVELRVVWSALTSTLVFPSKSFLSWYWYEDSLLGLASVGFRSVLSWRIVPSANVCSTAEQLARKRIGKNDIRSFARKPRFGFWRWWLGMVWCWWVGVWPCGRGFISESLAYFQQSDSENSGLESISYKAEYCGSLKGF